MSLVLVFLLFVQIKNQLVYQALNDSSSLDSKCSLDSNINYLLVKYQPATISFSIKEPHYAVDIYIDFYLIKDFLEEDITITMDSIQINQFNVKYDNSIPFCEADSGSEIKTIHSYYTHFQNSLTLEISHSGNMTLGIRNIQIYPKQCHESCYQCVGPSQNQCRSCYIGAKLGKSANACKCASPLNYLSVPNSVCLTKCDLYEYYDAKQNLCFTDTKINEVFQWFWSNFDSTGWTMIDNGILTNAQSLSYSTSNGKILGLLTQTQSISYTFNNTNQYQTLRVRTDIQIYQSTKIPQIYLQIDQVKQQATPLYSQNITSGKTTYQVYHIDVTMDCNQNSNITISIENDLNTRWGISQFTLNEVNCQKNCAVCGSKIQCQTCNSGYLLYNGQCVEQCPTYTYYQTPYCTEYYDEQNTAVLLRKFDDNLVSSFIIEDANSSEIYSYDQLRYGTYYNDKRYFGGLKDNRNYYISKTLTNLPPHYQLTINFELIIFNYIYSESISAANNVYFSVDKQKIYNFETDITYTSSPITHNNTDVTITLLSVAKDGTYLSFGISNLEIYVSRCYTLCKKCSGPEKTQCLEWIYEQNSNLLTHLCNSGYRFDYNTQKCELCPLGCAQCSDSLTCTTCESNYIQQGHSCYCLKGVIDPFTLECLLTS